MKKADLTPKNIAVMAFIAVEAVIYLIFNVLWFTLPDDPIALKYAGILLCLAMTGVFAYFHRDKDSVLLCFALFFTAVSDLFILVLDKYYEVGLVTFIITQSAYVYRLYEGRLNKIWITLTVRAAIIAAVIGIVGGLSGLSFLLVEVGIYIVMLAGNVVDAFLLCNKSRENMLFALGLLLFLGCDVCVGLHNGDMVGLQFSEASRNAIQFFIWFFYLPAQVLIVLSVARGGINKFAKKRHDTAAAEQPAVSAEQQAIEEQPAAEQLPEGENR